MLAGIGAAAERFWDAHKEEIVQVGLALVTRGMSAEASELSILGRNPRIGSGRVNTDLPGGRATGKSIFRHFTKGQPVTSEAMENGTIRRFAPDGTQIRMNPDGSTRLDLPRGPLGRETIHIKP
jgi:hypothetical protein